MKNQNDKIVKLLLPVIIDIVLFLEHIMIEIISISNTLVQNT